jgi:hypothetical protein
MTAPFLVYTREKRDLCCVSLWAGGVQDAEICTCFCAFYGDNAFSYDWVEILKKGQTSVTDMWGSGMSLNMNQR